MGDLHAMIFMLFAVGIAAVFFIGALISLNYGRRLGLQYRKHTNGESTAGLAPVEGAIFGLMGLLLAFTISGALQRFDDRRQLVLQEATAVTAAYDRLGLFGGDAARALNGKREAYGRPAAALHLIRHALSRGP